MLSTMSPESLKSKREVPAAYPLARPRLRPARSKDLKVALGQRRWGEAASLLQPVLLFKDSSYFRSAPGTRASIFFSCPAFFIIFLI